MNINHVRNAMNRRRINRILTPLILLTAGVLLQGCLLIRTTEHRIKLNDGGGGEAYMRLTDIRSDGVTDSARIRDFGVMMASAELDGIKDFERNGRKVTSKQFMVNGDTLSAEITYTFTQLEMLEGIKIKDDEIFVVVNDGRDIVRSNGKIKSWERGSQRIVWPIDTKRIMYQIRERSLPPSVSLAELYIRYNGKPSGGIR
jgi:hypothetical protein